MSRELIVMLGPDPDGRGGIAAVIRAYRDAGLTTQWPVRLISTHRDGGFVPKLAAWGTALARFAALVLSRRCACAHLHTASRASFWRKYSFYLLARVAGVPVIWHVHGGAFDRFFAESGAWRRRLIRGALRNAFRVVALSPRWAAFLREACPGAEVVVVPNGVAVAEPPAPMAREVHCVLFMGRITGDKGVFDLLEALRAITPYWPQARLRIAGTGAEEAMARRARELGMADRLEFLGWVTGTHKEAAIAGAGVLVLPSYIEGLPVILLEAMALGTPVIATRVGGVPELVQDGETGLLVEAGDTTALAAALLRILSEPGLAARLGGQGRERVRREFAIDVALSRLGNIYADIGMTATAGRMVRGD
ncbi:MAG TPA: glycosyltransferase family 4 protein [Burkholderiales bacterium]|jgi:glycosyltransferase involved in cell wall biosynthesis